MGTASPPSNEGGFSPLLLVRREGGQHLLVWVGGVGRQLWRRGEKTAIQDLITGWVHWKKYKTQKKITAPIWLSKYDFFTLLMHLLLRVTGFFPLLLVGQEGGQHLLLWVGGVGGQLSRRGGKTAIRDLITWWVRWKKLQNKKITAPISLSKCKILQIVIFPSQEHSHVVHTYSQPGSSWKKCQNVSSQNAFFKWFVFANCSFSHRRGIVVPFPSATNFTPYLAKDDFFLII